MTPLELLAMLEKDDWKLTGQRPREDDRHALLIAVKPLQTDIHCDHEDRPPLVAINAFGPGWEAELGQAVFLSEPLGDRRFICSVKSASIEALYNDLSRSLHVLRAAWEAAHAAAT